MIGIGSQICNSVNISRKHGFSLRGMDSIKLWYDLYPAPNELMTLDTSGIPTQVLSLLNKKNNGDIITSIGDSNGYIENNYLYMTHNSQPVYRSGLLPYFDNQPNGTIYLVMSFNPSYIPGDDLFIISDDSFDSTVWLTMAIFADGSTPMFRFRNRNQTDPLYYYEYAEFPACLRNGFAFLKIQRQYETGFTFITDIYSDSIMGGIDSYSGTSSTNYTLSFIGGNNILYEFIYQAGQPKNEDAICNYLLQKYLPIL